jgi:hypothetical protein
MQNMASPASPTFVFLFLIEQAEQFSMEMFLDNHMHGIGYYQWGDGRKFHGHWKQGRMSGEALASYTQCTE